MHARTHKGTHFTSAGHWTLLIEHWQCYSHSFWESKYFFYLLTFRKLYYSQKTIYFLSYCGCAELKIRLCYLLIMILDSPMNVLKNSYYSKLTFAKNLFFFLLCLSIIHNANENNKWNNVGDRDAILFTLYTSFWIANGLLWSIKQESGKRKLT